MKNIKQARVASFADRLYQSLVLTRVCVEMSSTSRVTSNSIKRIEMCAVPE